MQSAPPNLNNDEKDESKSMTNPLASISNDDQAILATQKKIHKNKIKVAATVAVLLGGGAGLVACSGAGAWRYYLAGGICAATSHAVATPVDVIKVS